MPTRAAIMRVDQCVDPSAGNSLCVSRSTSSTVPAGRLGLRPRPFAILPTPAMPSALNRERQRRTVSDSTPQRRAISSLATPSHAHKRPCAWITCRCDNDVEAAIRSNSARCCTVAVNAAATIVEFYQQITQLFHRHTTSV